MSITNTNNLVERYPYIIVSSGPEESEQVIHLIEPDKMIQEKLTRICLVLQIFNTSHEDYARK